MQAFTERGTSKQQRQGRLDVVVRLLQSARCLSAVEAHAHERLQRLRGRGWYLDRGLRKSFSGDHCTH